MSDDCNLAEATISNTYEIDIHAVAGFQGKTQMRAALMMESKSGAIPKKRAADAQQVVYARKAIALMNSSLAGVVEEVEANYKSLVNYLAGRVVRQKRVNATQASLLDRLIASLLADGRSLLVPLADG